LAIQQKVFPRVAFESHSRSNSAYEQWHPSSLYPWQSQLSFPAPVKFQCYGLTFVSSAKGGIDIFKTIKGLKPLRFLKEVMALPVEDYDLVISEFEPFSAWVCKLIGVTCIEMSHQAAVRAEGSPKTPLWFPVGRRL